MSTAHNLYIAPTASIGDGVTFGANVVVHEGVVIGDGVTVQDGAILGKQPKLAGGRDGHVAASLVIGDGAAICAQAVVFASAEIGPGAIIGDQSYVRERARIGGRSVVGRGTTIDNDVTVGARVSIQTQVYLTAFSTVEDDVFVGPCAMTTNDNTMNRHDTDYALRGATLRRACRIGGAVVITPGVEVGEEAFVAAGAIVTADVAPRAVVKGVPARVAARVGDEQLIERWR